MDLVWPVFVWRRELLQTIHYSLLSDYIVIFVYFRFLFTLHFTWHFTCLTYSLFGIVLLQRGLPFSPAPSSFLCLPLPSPLLISQPLLLIFFLSSVSLISVFPAGNRHGSYRPASAPVSGRETAEGGPRTDPVLEALGPLRGRETVGYRLVLFSL